MIGTDSTFDIPSWKLMLTFYSMTKISGKETNLMKQHPELTLEEIVTQEMQTWWPGGYKVVEYYDLRKGHFTLKLKFDNPSEETLWLLKWS